MERIDQFRGQYLFLSNFSPHPVIGANGLRYPTAEAAFQGGKTRDPQWRKRIAAARTPREAKHLGLKVPLADVPGWMKRQRYEVMRAVLRVKFADPALAAKLQATGDAELIEGNTWCDNHWGDCRCGRKACAEPGANWLGRLLMELRSEMASPLTLAA